MKLETPCFYFGTWGQAGHYLFTPQGMYLRHAGPWTEAMLDATPYERYGRERGQDTGKGVVPADPDEREGVWRLTHLGGWTAFGAWDRTCDRRGGSKAVFVAPGTLGGDDMRALAAHHFPTIWARITGGAK